MKFPPRRAVTLAVLAATTLGSTAVLAQAWPSKPIKFVVPFTAGGANDLMARAAAEGAGKVLGQTIVIDNKPGAGGTLGADGALLGLGRALRRARTKKSSPR